MTVKELIEQLSAIDGEKEVRVYDLDGFDGPIVEIEEHDEYIVIAGVE